MCKREKPFTEGVIYMANDFDIALSFAGTERDYARAIAAITEKNGLKVFLDEIYEAELWGENLVETLSDIYTNKAKFCLIIISQEYRNRVFTKVERRAALDRAIQEKAAYILPVVVDDSWIEGLPRATAYLDLRRKSVISICEVLIKKIKGKVPQKLSLPKGIQLTRLPIGNLGANDVKKYLLDLCAQSSHAGVVAFGCLVYDEGTVELRKLLKDEDYWDGLDRASGPSFEIFAVQDEQKHGYDAPKYIEMMTASSMNRSSSRGYYFSTLLKEYFDEEKTTLAYPSFILFLVEGGQVTHCGLIPLSRGSINDTYLKLQDLFSKIALSIEQWRESEKRTASSLWEVLKNELLNSEYTLYIQNAPKQAKEAIESLEKFIPA
jgi:hypothetical protein